MLTIDGSLAVITFARPDAGNAVNGDFARDLAAAADAVAADPAVRTLLIRSTGPFFCVGGDLKDFTAQGDRIQAYIGELAEIFHRAVVALDGLSIPVVTAVHGPAVGAGVSLACRGDIAIAAESAWFRVGYTAVGLSPDGGGSWFLPRLVGRRAAADLVLSNRTVDADEALALGLVSRVVPDGAVHDEAEALARSLAAGPAAAFAATKRLLAAAPTADLRDHLDQEAASIVELVGTADGREGLAAFLERRTPHFL